MRGWRTKARDLVDGVSVDSMMRKEGGGDWAASSRARVKPVGPAPIMRMSVSFIVVFREEVELSLLR